MTPVDVSAVTAAPGVSRLRLVIVLGGLSAFPPLSIDMYLPALPALSHDLHATASSVQLTLTACLVGLGAGQLVSGPLSDRFGRRRPVLVGLALYTLLSAACAAAPDIWTLAALRLGQGAAGAAAVVVARATVRDLYAGSAAARFFATLMLVNGLAPTLAPLLGAGILAFTVWRGIFVGLAVLSALLLVATAVGLPETLAVADRRPGGASAARHVFRELLGDREFVGYASAYGLTFAMLFAYIAGSPFLLEGIYGVSPTLFATVFAANSFGLIAASQVSGRLVERVGPARLLHAGLALASGGAAGLLVAIVAGGPLALVLALLFATVSSVGLVGPNATALALAGHGHHAGSASALLGIAQFSFGATAAPLVGVAGQGTALPLGIVAALSTGAAAVAARAAGRRKL